MVYNDEVVNNIDGEASTKAQHANVTQLELVRVSAVTDRNKILFGHLLLIAIHLLTVCA